MNISQAQASLLEGQPRDCDSSIRRLVFRWPGRDTPGASIQAPPLCSVISIRMWKWLKVSLTRTWMGIPAHRVCSAQATMVSERAVPWGAPSSTQSTSRLCAYICGAAHGASRWKQPNVGQLSSGVDNGNVVHAGTGRSFSLGKEGDSDTLHTAGP